MKRLFFSLALLGLAGCSDKAPVEENLLMSTDFESLYGWLPAPQSDLLSREQAHSGTYAIKVDPQHEYSITYRAVLGALHDTRINKMKVSAWVFVPDAQARATLVVVVTDRGEKPKELLWEGIELQQEVAGEYGRWVKIAKELTLPAETNSANELSIYLWRTGGDKAIFLDDLALHNTTPVK